MLTTLALTACERAPEQPNLVLISIDTLRADHMGLYGYERDTTPHLDRVFQNATKLRAMSSAPCTVPAVRQLLTGRLDRAASGTSLPEVLARTGYRTAAIVSQHQFHWDGLPNYSAGFGEFDVQDENEIDQHEMTARTAGDVSARAVKWLETNGGDQPFFLWLHYFDPHDPYTPPAAHRRFGSGSAAKAGGDRRTAPAKRYPFPADPTVQAEEFSPADATRFRDEYDGEIHYTDAQIGRVLSTLESLGLVDRTVIALTSDHAERLGTTAPLWGHCKTLHRFETEVPLLFLDRARPTKIADDAPAGTLDILPTLLGLLDVDYEKQRYDGADLASGGTARVAPSIWRGQRALWDGRWKLYLDPSGDPAELFDTKDDPDETTDVLDDHADVARRLQQQGDVSAEAARRSATATRRAFDRLKALGYIQ